MPFDIVVLVKWAATRAAVTWKRRWSSFIPWPSRNKPRLAITHPRLLESLSSWHQGEVVPTFFEVFSCWNTPRCFFLGASPALSCRRFPDLLLQSCYKRRCSRWNVRVLSLAFLLQSSQSERWLDQVAICSQQIRDYLRHLFSFSKMQISPYLNTAKFHQRSWNRLTVFTSEVP